MFFDAIGHSAIGQVLNNNIFLIAGTGVFSLTGNAATFKITEVALGASFLETGNAATFKITEVALGASYVLTGFNANEIVFLVEGAGSFILTGFDAGYYRDFVNWFPATEPQGSSWQGAGAPSSGWTNVSTSVSNWTVDSVMSIPPPERV